jgi:FkbM family methyltransferase
MKKQLQGLRNKWLGFGEVLQFSNWPELLLGLTLFRKTGVKIYRFGRFQFLCDQEQGDENSIRAAVATPMYRELISDLPLEQELSVLDLGANAGGFVALLLSRGHRLRQVWAVEMNPYTCQRLAFNLGHNLGPAGKACNLALSGQDTRFEVELGRGSTSDSLYGAARGGERIGVQGLTFDSFWKEYVRLEHVDLCKIDIEGAEFEMLLEGKAECLARCRRCIIEVHPRTGRTREELKAVFKRQGFVQVNEVDEPAEGTVVWSWKNERM